MLIDAHSHLSLYALESEIESAIAEARAVGVRKMILAGFDPADWHRQLDLQARIHSIDIHCVFGMHPWWIARANDDPVLESALLELERLLPRAVALGELGLDFYSKKFGPETHARQIVWFERQLDLAFKNDKPIVLHVVAAHEKALEILRGRSRGRPSYSGIVHGFSGNVTIAKAYADLGLTLSIGNGALKKGYENVKRAIKQIDLKHWVLESDAPDQIQPADVAKVARAVAELKGVELEEVARVTTENVARAYRLAATTDIQR